VELSDLLPKLIRPDQLAKTLGVAQVTIYSWVRRGVIPHLKLEGVVRFDPEEIAQWLRERSIPAGKLPGGKLKGAAN
jgi:excisionase family DNA binding protein